MKEGELGSLLSLTHCFSWGKSSKYCFDKHYTPVTKFPPNIVLKYYKTNRQKVCHFAFHFITHITGGYDWKGLLTMFPSSSASYTTMDKHSRMQSFLVCLITFGEWSFCNNFWEVLEDDHKYIQHCKEEQSQIRCWHHETLACLDAGVKRQHPNVPIEGKLRCFLANGHITKVLTKIMPSHINE